MRPGQLEPNDFELAILERLARQEPSIRPFINGLHVLSREFTGVGSFTKFKCDAVGSSRQNVSLKSAIRMPRIPSGMTAVLFCNGGMPDLLEVCTFGDELWDGLYDGFAIEGTD